MNKVIMLLIMFCFSCSSYALGKLGDVEIHGFLSQGYLITTENDYYFSKTKDGTFQFNEMGLNFGTNVTDSLRLGIQLFARDLGVISNDEVMVNYAMADYNYQEWLGLRVGKIKKPHGLYNQSRDVDAGRLSIFLPQSIYHESYRDQLLAIKGAMLYGRLFEQLDYQVFYGVTDMGKDCGFSYVVTVLTGVMPDSYSVKPLGGLSFLWNTPIQGVNLGSTFVDFDLDVNTSLLGTIKLSGYQYIASLEYIYEDFMFSGEFSRVPRDIKMAGIPVISQESEFYYAMASYRILDWLEFGGGYSALYTDIDDRDDPKWNVKDFFLSIRFDVNEAWTIKFEGHSMNGLLSISEPDASEDWLMFAAKATFNF